LITAEQPYRNLWQVARGSSSDHITKTVTACSVLRLQAPLDRTHETFDWERAKEQLETMRLSEYVDRSCVVVGLEVASKHALFETLAELMGAGAGAEVDQHDVLSALWERERIHGTAAGMGLALPHATVARARGTRIGIVTLARPIDYGGPVPRGVDVLFVTLSSAGKRRSHLLVMSAISKVVLETNVLERLRRAQNEDQVIEALESCFRQTNRN
jgi:mannitol/fructose-specific phosphotransferase system IIA component (Ntr-type)